MPSSEDTEIQDHLIAEAVILRGTVSSVPAVRLPLFTDKFYRQNAMLRTFRRTEKLLFILLERLPSCAG